MLSFCLQLLAVLTNVRLDIATLITAAIGLCTAAVAALYSLAAWRLASRSAPDELVRHVGALRVEVKECRGEMDEYKARVVSWRAELEAVLESVETVLSQVERKRRSTAASASKIAQADGPDQNVMTMDHNELEKLARERGLWR